jgi:hypothetical protein
MKDKKKKKHKNGGPDHGDAQIVLQLYDFRREAQMREARKFIVGEWWPQNADEVIKIVNSFGTVENQHFRQVFSFWEMASSLVHRGVLNGDLFDDWSNELYFCFAKIKPFLKQVRESTGSPKMYSNIERITQRTPESQEKLKTVEARVKKAAQRVSAASASASGSRAS